MVPVDHCVVQVSGALLPLQHRCTWKYDQLTTVQQNNIAACYPDFVSELAAYKAYENKLFNDVYPVLARSSPASRTCMWHAVSV